MSKFNATAPSFTPGDVSVTPGVVPAVSVNVAPPASIHLPPKSQKQKTQKVKTPKSPRPPRSQPKFTHARPVTRPGTQKSLDTGIDNYEMFLEDSLANGQLKTSGRKGRISLNHLLDLSYEETRDFPPVTHRRKYPTREKVHLSGAAYINANYKFVVDHRYSSAQDPNLPVEHSSILRVVVPRGLQACPICLSDDPVAPRMLTNCGHVLCLTCLLSLMDSKPLEKAPQKYKECPLCAVRVNPKTVLPVLINDVDLSFETPKVGDEVILTLLARPHNHMVPVPVNMLPFLGNRQSSKISPIPWHFQHEAALSSRLVKGDLRYVLDQYEQEVLQINESFETDKLLYGVHNANQVHVFKAVEQIRHEQELAKIRFEHGEQLLPAAIEELCNFQLPAGDLGMVFNDANTSFFYSTAFNNITTHYFLSPLDVKILRASHGGQYSAFPAVLIKKIRNIVPFELTLGNVTSTLKYLNYLPLGTQLAWLECEWGRNELHPDVWAEFLLAITSRDKRLKTKAVVEERNKVHAMRREEQHMRDFYQRENNSFVHQVNNGWEQTPTEGFPHEHLNDGDALPALEHGEQPVSGVKQYTVWGTAIPAGDKDEDEETQVLLEQLRQQKLDTPGKSGPGKKKKKKLVLLSSTNSRMG
ncbi:hypothetical protein BABINDRAFT_162339 [Babjeviella inositovora NRRL Y-12698]|uniref:RING-type domain-containing protein n=1 Tax=Babjeviella inositovora NRRL Y-12698 TaxID=984486 RepID=A0A1E3QLP8_9ASCO|nr:uncharacterized protein BABINDRAFT_162339 [Babjeviella inositovora NRRL Y-12698]ODQ78629.1 hypothetical protein BABINDRAFT_162339 [Babjeviella inositovora NRRL Y-12698]